MTPFLIKEKGIAQRIQLSLEDEIQKRRYKLTAEWKYGETFLVYKIINEERALLNKSPVSIAIVWAMMKSSYGTADFTYKVGKKGEQLVLKD